MLPAMNPASLLQQRFAGIDRLYGAGSMNDCSGATSASSGWAVSAPGLPKRWPAVRSAASP
jgi:hypothetical protein